MKLPTNVVAVPPLATAILSSPAIGAVLLLSAPINAKAPLPIVPAIKRSEFGSYDNSKTGVLGMPVAAVFQLL